MSPLELLVMEVLLVRPGERACLVVRQTEGTSNMEGAAPRVEMESSSLGIPSLIVLEGRVVGETEGQAED